METSRRHGPAKRQPVHGLICRDTHTDLSTQAARAIIEPYFRAMQEIFAAYERNVLPEARMVRVRLECSPAMHDTPRHFAGCAETGRLIAVAPELAELPEQTVLAIVAHEFGHAMDYSWPGCYVLSDGELIERAAYGLRATADEDKRAVQARLAAARHFRDRDHDTIEKTADLIAERVTGVAIGYVGPCELQSFGRGAPRPKGLR